MFRIFKNLVLYFSILSSCAYARPLQPTDEVTPKDTDLPRIHTGPPFNYELVGKDISIGVEVQQEAAPYEGMTKVSDMLLSLKQWIRRAIVAERKNETDRKITEIEVPLVFRNYVTKIEDNFPEVNERIPAHIMKNQKVHLGILKRKYNWIKILSNDRYSHDDYVKLLKAAIKKKFFSDKNISLDKGIFDLTKEQRKEYDEFLEKFCHAIAVSVDYVNRVIAHNKFGKFVKGSLNLFDAAHDEYVSLFYHAVISRNSEEEKTE
ncbi:uncharacterized protein LOC135843861 isoform X2 [Planococcus citri]|uniref:uncharacterized protein LOC135843861 isoform X2 n=1 Tax=Planococcus citri TaxID=170843 RepID=UPI0031F8990F